MSYTEPTPETVRAAGGLVVRPGTDGPEVLVVHRPRYDDWTIPKGKLDPGETWEAAAQREVEEETGFRCELGDYLGEISYRERKGRRKVVRYWRMTVLDGSFTPNDEVDELAWLRPADAAAVLTYDRDRALPLLADPPD